MKLQTYEHSKQAITYFSWRPSSKNGCKAWKAYLISSWVENSHLFHYVFMYKFPFIHYSSRDRDKVLKEVFYSSCIHESLWWAQIWLCSSPESPFSKEECMANKVTVSCHVKAINHLVERMHCKVAFSKRMSSSSFLHSRAVMHHLNKPNHSGMVP